MPAHDQLQSPVRVVLVDDHTIVRTAIARMLDGHEEVELVGDAGDIAGALEVVQVKRPDIVILDIELGSDDSVESLPDMLSHLHKPRVLIFSMHDEPEQVQRAFAAGALGYLLKEAGEADLIEAIRALARGKRYVHPTLGARLAEQALANPAELLTDRERDIVRLLALGHTNQEVADQLFLSIRTVETHRSRATTKLGTCTRAQLVRWALDSGLIGRRR